ncbi:MAG: glycosyltransferase family 2 protein [Planctomycetota bacterium]|jgi:glycosyltransferase involved in cell wall biosynthesis
MLELLKGKATICVANYKTPDFTKLCLRSIRKFTNYPYQVVVVDNDSQDESLEYLRGLGWIRLIERARGVDGPGGGFAHAAALDAGLENCNTEFFVSMHSDTFVKKVNWLTELISYFGNDANIACVGSGKVELRPMWRVILKKTTDFRTFKRKLLREPDPLGKHRYYNRTICCIYRTGVLRSEKLSFGTDQDKGLTGGKKLYFELVDRGYKTVELPSRTMGQYVIHVAHATQAVNPEDFTLRRRTVRKCRRLTNKIMGLETFRSIMADDSLDV